MCGRAAIGKNEDGGVSEGGGGLEEREKEPWVKSGKFFFCFVVVVNSLFNR